MALSIIAMRSSNLSIKGPTVDDIRNMMHDDLRLHGELLTAFVPDSLFVWSFSDIQLLYRK
jgi:hypothetical protein